MNFLDPRLPKQFWDKVQPCPMSGCWLWTGCTLQNGYGQIRIKQQSHSVHRLSVEVDRGPIPAGLTVDHKCETKCCCNPAHLDVVSNAENVARYWKRNPVSELCPSGHSRTVENTYARGSMTGRCRPCHNALIERRRLQAISEGRCGCGRDKRAGARLCDGCTDYRRQYEQRKSAAKAAARALAAGVVS